MDSTRQLKYGIAYSEVSLERALSQVGRYLFLFVCDGHGGDQVALKMGSEFTKHMKTEVAKLDATASPEVTPPRGTMLDASIKFLVLCVSYCTRRLRICRINCVMNSLSPLHVIHLSPDCLLAFRVWQIVYVHVTGPRWKPASSKMGARLSQVLNMVHSRHITAAADSVR